MQALPLLIQLIPTRELREDVEPEVNVAGVVMASDPNKGIESPLSPLDLSSPTL